MNNLKSLREGKNLTLREMASLINVSNNTISQWETGKRQPDNSTLIKLANFFEVSIDYLLGRNFERKMNSFKNNLHEEIFDLIIQLDDKHLHQVKGFIMGCLENMNSVNTNNKKSDAV